MSDPTIPPKPSESPAPKLAPGAIVTCQASCVPMEIEVSEQAAPLAAYVQLKPPAAIQGRPRIRCTIRAAATAPQAMRVVLTNPDGRLRFPEQGDLTTTLQVPADGSPVEFEVSGESGSLALNDAVIEAHCNLATGPKVAAKSMTVFWFDNAKVDVRPKAHYAYVNGTVSLIGADAVEISAVARIRPAGIDCLHPKVRSLRVGIVQNDVTCGTFETLRWGRPTVVWDKLEAGRSATVRATSQIVMTYASSVPMNDGSKSMTPLYGFGPSAIRPPLGCQGGGAAMAADSPQSVAEATTRSFTAKDAGGHRVGTLIYQLDRVVLHLRFLVWAVVIDQSTNDFQVLRQISWGVDVDSSVTQPQRAHADAHDAAPTVMPVITPSTDDIAGLQTYRRDDDPHMVTFER